MEVKHGYKVSEFGIIPEDWDPRPIHTFAEIRGRVGWKGYTKKDLVAYGPYAIGAKHIDASNRLDLSNPTCLSKSKFLESPEIMVRTGDVLIVQRGTLGKLTLVDQCIGDATINPSMVILRTRNVSPGFVTYYLLSHSGQTQILADTSTTGVPMISQRQIENFLVPLPPTKAEQEAIAEALRDTDALIESLEQLLAKKRQVKQGAMQELLTGKKRLPGFSGEWEVKRLGEVCRITTGNKDVNEGNPEGQFPFFTCSRSHTFSDSYSFDAEAILIAGNGEVGNLHYFKGKFEAYQRTYVLSQFSTHVGYLWQQLSAYLTDSLGLGKIGSSIPYIKKENLVGFEFNSPQDGAEQTAIAAILSDMDAEIAALETKLAKARQLKQGMMQELLTGRIRLV